MCFDVHKDVRSEVREREVTVLERDFLEEVGFESGLKTQKDKGDYSRQGAAWVHALQ